MTSLFGWCLPEMSEEDHQRCMNNFKFHETTVECSCSCHDREEIINEATTSSGSNSEGTKAEKKTNSETVI
jgi:hypothetical protein